MGGRCPRAPSSLATPGDRGRCAGDVLSARAGLSEIRWALAGAAPRQAVRGALQGLLEDGAELRACRLRRVKLKPGRKLTVHYDAWVRTGSTEIKRPVVVVWDGGDGRTACDPRTATLEAQAVADGLAAPFRGLFARLPPWNASVQVFPGRPLPPA